MGTPPLLQGALPPAPRWLPGLGHATRLHPASILTVTAAGGVWGSGAAAVTHPLACWCCAAERASWSDGSAPQQHSPGTAGGESGPWPPATQPPASTAGSRVLTKWKYFSVSKSFTVKHKRERETAAQPGDPNRNPPLQMPSVSGGVSLSPRIPTRSWCSHPKQPQRFCVGGVCRFLGCMASTSGSTLRRTQSLPRGVLSGTQEGARAGSAQGHSCIMMLCDAL